VSLNSLYKNNKYNNVEYVQQVWQTGQSYNDADIKYHRTIIGCIKTTAWRCINK